MLYNIYFNFFYFGNFFWQSLYKYGTIPFSAESADEQWWITPHQKPGHRGVLVHQKQPDINLPIPEMGVSDWVGFSQDAAYFAASGVFRNASIYETSTRRRVVPISDNLPQIHRGGSFSPDNHRFAACSKEKHELKLWDLDTGQPVLSFTNENAGFYGVEYSTGGNLIGAQSNGKLHIWRAPTWPQIKAIGERENLPERSISY